MEKLKTFQFVSYDTWGNAKGGYEINDAREEGIFWQGTEFPSFPQIIACLKRCGYLSKRFRFSSQYPYDSLEVIEYRGKPIGAVHETEREAGGNWFTLGLNSFRGLPAVIFRQTKKGYRRIA